jgi:hypothetical protein
MAWECEWPELEIICEKMKMTIFLAFVITPNAKHCVVYKATQDNRESTMFSEKE